MTTCPLCPGACQGATLAPLTCPQLTWLWERVALRADATADDLTRGSLAITLPDSPELLAAAGTLLSNRPLLAGRRIRVDLPRLTGLLRTRGPLLTPAAVAAHALERRVGEPSLERQRTAQRRQQITALANDLLGALPRSCPVRPSPQAAVEVLRYKGWIARLSLRPDGELLLRQAVTTLQSLPTAGSVVDRRHLAQDATGHPKSLDRGHPLARLVLALTEAAGHTPEPGHHRQALARLGIQGDKVTGGLVAQGIHPTAVTAAPDAVLVLPEDLLESSPWPPAPGPANWVFVTENPSILAAARLQGPSPVPLRVLCTDGTPSGAEVRAIARLADMGWHIAARADFDEAGLRHLNSILTAQPRAVPWRMSTDDYLTCLRRYPFPDTTPALASRELHTPWDHALAHAMAAHSRPGFEEALRHELADDVRRGAPAVPPRAQPASRGPDDAGARSKTDLPPASGLE